jgi:hypothetical protein
MQEVILTDYLFGPEVILHKRIVNEMQKLNMKGIKFIPAKLKFRDWNCEFKPMEYAQIIIPHSVKNIISALNPTGLYFYNIEER